MVSDETLRTVFGMSPPVVRLWGNLIRGLSALVVCLVLAALTLAYVDTVRQTIALRHFQDFGVFYESALGHVVGPDTASQLPWHGVPRSPNLNPPHFNFVIVPFTWLEPTPAFAAWLLASAVLLVASLVLISRSLMLGAWGIFALSVFALAAVPMVSTLMSGQVGLFLLLPFTLAWVAARQDRQASAGAWLGLCASIKPFFLLFSVYFVLTHQRRAAVASLVPVGALFVAGLAYYGADPYRLWLDHLSSVTWAEHYMNASVLGFVERTFSTTEWQQVPIADWPKLVWPLWAALCAVVATVTLVRVRVGADVDRQFLLLTTAALLLSPLGWTYYFWFLLAPAVAVVVSGDVGRDRWRRVLMLLGLIGALVPPRVPWEALQLGSGLGTATIASLYFWVIVALWVVAVPPRDRAHVGL